jgi:hypothetical protein
MLMDLATDGYYSVSIIFKNLLAFWKSDSANSLILHALSERSVPPSTALEHRLDGIT